MSYRDEPPLDPDALRLPGLDLLERCGGPGGPRFLAHRDGLGRLVGEYLVTGLVEGDAVTRESRDKARRSRWSWDFWTRRLKIKDPRDASDPAPIDLM